MPGGDTYFSRGSIPPPDGPPQQTSYSMCGIAGIIGGGDESTLTRMVHVQAHRGPDDWGVQWFAEHGCGLGHRRLSILDLSPAGHQPMVNQRGNRWITFNGEIYNFLELRAELERHGFHFRSETDTEVILAAYDHWGKECVRRFNGMFAFGIYDTDTRELFLARDHLGIKPLYYTHRGPMLAFASEAKALFEIPGVSRDVDFDAVVSTLLFLWVPEPKTGFRAVWKLEPGHYATFRDGRMVTTEYWDVPAGTGIGLAERSEVEYVEELRSILDRVIRRQMISDVPVGAFLSGGLDSSLVVALMRKVTSGPIRTYTIGFSKIDKKMEAMPDDARFAAMIARRFETEHHEIEADPDIRELWPRIQWHLDDPVGDGAAINTYLIAKGARDLGTTVLLNGMGGDEVFGGYRKQLATLLLRRYHYIPAAIRRGVIEPFVDALPVAVGGRGIRSVRWAKKFVRSASLAPLDSFMFGFSNFNAGELDELLRDHLAGMEFDDLYPVRRYREAAARVKDLPFIDQMLYLDTKLFLPGLNLLYSDKAAMAASIETRPPLIDLEIIEYASRLPGKYKINGRVQKYMLKKAAEAYIPEEVIYRPKAAFGTPIRSWMKERLAEQALSSFTRSDSAFASMVRRDLPIRLLHEHATGQEDHAHRLWGLFSLASWLTIQQGLTISNADVIS